MIFFVCNFIPELLLFQFPVPVWSNGYWKSTTLSVISAIAFSNNT